MNQVMLIGRLAADPEQQFVPSGDPVTNFRVAVDRPGKAGGEDEKADFVPVVCWRQQAEFAYEYLKKGRLVSIEGRLRVRSWEQDGQRRRAIEVVAYRVQALDKKPQADGEDQGQGPAQADSPNATVSRHSEQAPEPQPDDPFSV